MGERQFGPYRLVHQIAVGGMAEIHLAKTHGIAGFEKYVALKMIHPNFSSDEQFIEMLIDEAKISVQLQHANIAQTFDLGRVDETYYITMEFVDGADLYKILHRAAERGIQMPVDVAAFIAKEMANGLDYAHRKRDLSGKPLGIVHRDVSPQNVLVSHAGEVKLVDFGIAKATMKVRQTAVGVIKGKYYYMSPEQAWGDRVDHRTDVFSTGICLYEALTGRMLYQEEDLHRLLQMVRRADIPPPTSRRRDVPPQLERIVMNALNKDRDARYKTAADMATDLERFLHVYSPVFTASKLAEFFRMVLGDELPPTVEEPPPSAPAPSVPMHTMRLEPDQILNDSAELSDENSVIFRLDRPPPANRPPPMHTVSTSAHTITGMSARGSDFGADDLDNIEEQTMVSGPPGFGMPGGGGGGDFEPTMVGTGFQDGSPFDEGETEGVSADIHDGPTLLQHNQGDIQQRLREANRMAEAQPPPRPAARPRVPARGPKAGASHPALAASTPKPAISLTGPRRSRKTPTDGLPAEGGSLLASLVQRDQVGGPVRREPGSSGEATVPARPGASSPGPGPVPSAAPSPPGQLPGAAPDQPGAGAWQASFPGAPGSGFPGQSPFSPLPTGQPPASFTKQLQALELEDIPSAYKVGRKVIPRWLLAAVLVVGCVTAGVALGIVFLGGQSKETALLIESNPPGAQVTVNGVSLADRTPLRFPAETSTRYEIVFVKEKYQSKTHAVLVPNEPREYGVRVTLQRVRASVEVTSTPSNTEIYLNDTLQGRTPRTLSNLDPDVDYTLELRHRGYKPHKQKLVWPDGQTELSLDIHLDK